MNNFKELMFKSQFEHFQIKIISILHNKPHGSQTARSFSDKHETSVTRFLTKSPWSAEKLDKQRISHAFQVLNQTYNKYVNIVVDDSTSKREYANDLVNIQYHYKGDDGVEGKPVKGQTFVTTQLVVGGRDIPLFGVSYDKESDQSKIDLAICQVNKAIKIIKPLLKKHQRILVLADSWYNGEPFLSPIINEGIDVISPLKSNRNITIDGKELKITEIVDRIDKRKFKKIEVNGNRYRFVKLTGGVKGFTDSEFTIIVNQKLQQKEDGTFKWSKVKFLMCTDASLSTYAIFHNYQRRWKIETFYQFAKYELGLDKSRSYKERALLRFILLVFFAYTYLCLAGYELTPLHICNGSYYQVRDAVLRENKKELISWVYIQGQEGHPFKELLLKMALTEISA